MVALSSKAFGFILPSSACGFHFLVQNGCSSSCYHIPMQAKRKKGGQRRVYLLPGKDSAPQWHTIFTLKFHQARSQLQGNWEIQSLTRHIDNTSPQNKAGCSVTKDDRNNYSRDWQLENTATLPSSVVDARSTLEVLCRTCIPYFPRQRHPVGEYLLEHHFIIIFIIFLTCTYIQATNVTECLI